MDFDLKAPAVSLSWRKSTSNPSSIKTVPEDIEVIGFTDGLISEFATPSLTTVAQHGRSMGHKALELLLDEIDSQDAHYQYRTNLIQTDLKIRNSTKKIQFQN